MDKRKLEQLPNLSDEDRRRYANALERAEKAAAGHGLTYAGFFDPRQRGQLAVLLNSCGVRYRFDGGMSDETERVVAVFVPEYYEALSVQDLRELDEYPITGVRIRVSGLRQTGKVLTHRDYLGTLMGLGIRRDTIGDIYPNEDGCTVAVLKEVAGHILAQLEKVSSLGAQASLCAWSEFVVPQANIQEIRGTVAAARLDCVASECFGTSRTRAQEAIRQGLVARNWLECRNVSEPVCNGDQLSWKGKGRAKLIECERVTRKGNLVMVIHKYI